MKLSFKNILLMFLMLLCAALTAALQPTVSLADKRPPINLSSLIPTTFGDWKEQINISAQIINPLEKKILDKTYSETLSRTYVNGQGERVMLSIAYGKTQRADLQLHHPELCYPAQGFELLSNRNGQLKTPYGAIPVRRLETRLNQARTEPVTYWAMIGEQVVLGSVRRKLVELQYGLRGEMADGLLFRVSSIEKNSQTAFDQQALFVSALLEALSPADRHRISSL